MKLPLFKKKLTVPQIGTVIFVVICAIALAFFLIPQIDHQPWYPEQLGTYDIPLGIDFRDHTSVTMDLSGLDVTDSNFNNTLQLLNLRMTRMNVRDANVRYANDTINIDISSEFDNQTISALTSRGVIELKKAKDDLNTEEDPLLAFDPENYEDTQLSTSDIASAKITNENEQFTYIELKIASDKKENWDSFAAENPTGTIGLMIDGAIYQAWLLQPDGQNLKNHTLVITELPPTSYLILSYINDGPLPVEGLTSVTAERKAPFSNQDIYKLVAVFIGMFGITLVVRIAVLKQNLVTTLATGLIIAGAVVILKLSGIPLSILLLSGITFIATAITLSSPTLQLPIFIVFFLASLVMRMSSSPVLMTLSHVFLVFGLLGTLSTLFFSLIRIYEE